MKPAPPSDRRGDFMHFLEIQTRWSDNDIYGHVNNVLYYSYFDTVINNYLIDSGRLDLEKSEVIGVCVESQCRYLESVTYPERLEAGLRIAEIGRSSVRYELGVFRLERDEPAALGYFVHVFVDRTTRKPVALPEQLRSALAKIARSPIA